MTKQSLSAQIRDHILEKIESGEWMPDSRVPAESELMNQFGASRMTVHRVVKDLATEGYIYRQRGLGSFVARRTPRSDLLVIGDISEEIRQRGGDYFAELKYMAAEPQTPLTAHVFGDRSKSSIARSKVVHYENGLPIQLEDRYVDLRTAPKYLELDLNETTAHKYLMKVAPLQKVEHELSAILPTREHQSFLQIQPTEPCLLLKRRTWSRDRLVSYAELVYPGTRFTFGGVFKPKGK